VKVHHLNCGTMTPPLMPEPLVAHVLLLEMDSGLALVDSGFGLQDLDGSATRLGPSRHLIRPLLEESETAIRQVEALGFHPRDVRDIVLTHFDADHVGGLADFPWARVHLTDAEAHAAWHPRGLAERGRYLPGPRAHDPVLVRHTPIHGDTWRGFPAAQELSMIGEGIILIALPGHSRGHAMVAVDAGSHWVLHAGDAFYYQGQIGGPGPVPQPIPLLERLLAADASQVRDNHARLTQVWAAREPDLLLVNAHDPALYRRALAAAHTTG
jgi:glyoxylase-like metal-dependent hydrolase (beta-lactamase superfamily II)